MRSTHTFKPGVVKNWVTELEMLEYYIPNE